MATGAYGKDFVAGFIALWFFLTRTPCRVVTTSVDGTQLEAVLWGEIRRFVQTARIPLDHTKGGPLIVNHLHLRKVLNGVVDGLSYCIGRVAAKGEGMLGHHIADTGDGIPRTLFIADEACHDADTEVLTDSGWRKFSSLTGTEKLLCMDAATRIATYVQPTSITACRRTGPMYLHHQRGSNFCVTPKHRMLWRHRRPKCREPYSAYYVQQIQHIRNTRYIPRCFVWRGEHKDTILLPGYRGDRRTWGDRQVDAGDWLEFLGWYIAEGNIGWAHGAPWYIAISQKNIATRGRIFRLAQRLGFNPCMCEGQSPSVRINEKRLAAHLLTFGRYCWEKRIPEIVGEMNPALIERFLQSFCEGDGYIRDQGREIYYTSSPHIADELQVLSYKTGRTSTVCQRSLIGLPAPHGESRRDGFVVSRSQPGLDSHIKLKPCDIETVDYDGIVYCANVPPHHTLFTRRGGVCMWSGNSGVEDESYRRSETWARRKLIIGNPYPCTNFFKAGVKAGDLLDPHYRLPSADDSSIPQAPHERYYRKVIRIRGEDSPNVRVALGRMSIGLPPESSVGGGSPVVLPGVLPYPDYRKRRETWDEIMQTIGLDALFYEGAEVLLYPPLWLDRAHRIAEAIDRGDKALLTGKYRRAEAIGIDPGEGGADTALCVIDHQGIIDMIAHKTPDTSDITDLAIEYMRVYDVPDHRVVFDRGGGGKQHADRMRRMGYKRIRTVAFGESVNIPMRRSRVMFEEKLDIQEERYAYKNRRAEMYGRLRELLDPVHEGGFGIPRNLQELRRQLAPIPLMFDPEGRLELPPKDKKDPESKIKTLKEILGCSPDQADALVLAVHALFAKSIRPRAGSI